MAECLPELLEEEWAKFRFAEQQTEIEPLLDEPLLMVPVIDEKTTRRVPHQLLHVTKDLDLVKMRIRSFFTLRYMVFHLTRNDGQSHLRFRENPMTREDREVARWQIGSSYEVASQEIELILCNVKLQGKMQVRYVLVDQDYFVLVEPDLTRHEEYRVRVHIKQPLKQVESMIDRTEPRNLIIGFAIYQKSSAKVISIFYLLMKPILEEMLLYFENMHKCSYVKNKLDHTKKTSKQILIQKAASFFERCL